MSITSIPPASARFIYIFPPPGAEMIDMDYKQPRVVANFQPESSSLEIETFELVPIKHSRILFIGTFSKGYHLCFTIHEIHSYRIGPALCTWTLRTSNDIFRLPPIGKESTTNTLGITFGANCTSRCMELFELSLERGNHFNMTGQINFDQEIRGIGASYVGLL